MKRVLFLFFMTTLAASEPLSVGASFVTPPLEFVRRHKQVGFEVDIVRALADKMGRDVIFIDAPYHQLPSLLKEGQCDIILGGYVHGVQSISEARSYYEAKVAVLIDHKRRPDVKALADLRGGVIGIVEGTGLESVAKEYGSVRVYKPERLIDALADLNFGRIDALFHLDIMMAYLKYASPTISVLGEVPDTNCPLVFGVKAELKQAVNEALEQVALEPICHRWFGIIPCKGY